MTTAELERDCRELYTSLLPVADGDASSREVLTFSGLLDALGLWTFESYAAARDEIIKEQSEQLLELTTPVVKLWEAALGSGNGPGVHQPHHSPWRPGPAGHRRPLEHGRQPVDDG